MLLQSLFRFFLYGLFCGFPLFSSGQFYLQVSDPQSPWKSSKALIEEAIFTLKPQGAYTEVGMFLTFSAKGSESFFTPGLPLEVRYEFDLPKEAMVTDSWLWVEKDVIRAKILDRWTASSIYENIVNRRRDPSILFKDFSGHYRLQIYPMPMGTSRKVKITYLLPNSWTEREVISSISGSLLAVSRSVPDLQVRIFPSPTWKSPKVLTHPDIVFREASTPELGNFQVATLPGNYLKFGRNVDFTLDAPWNNGIFLTRYGSGAEGFYQLGILPSKILGAHQSLPAQRLMVLLHHNPEKVFGLSVKDYLAAIRKQMLEDFSPGDYFNVMLANLSPAPLSQTWVPATEANINALFDQIQNIPISVSHLPTLIGKAISWIGEKQEGGKIILFANSNSEGDPNIANPLLRELAALQNSKKIPCYIADFQNINTVFYFAGGTRYSGNGYFYLNLAKQTGGDFLAQQDCCGQFDGLVENIFKLAFSELAQIDFHTGLKQGFCFNRYPIGSSTLEEIDLNKPVFQIGKYQGQWPFLVELAGSYNDNLFFNGLDLDESVLLPADSTLATLWNGYYIRSLEQETANNRSIGEILRISLSERILSLYTAFLCLEPSLGGEPCPTCLDESKGEVTSTKDLDLGKQVQVKFSPNPFSDRVRIQLRFPDGLELQTCHIAIYNTLGQEVYAFQELPKGRINDLSLNWNGTTNAGKEVPAGVYFFSIRGTNGKTAYPLVFSPRS